jgi:predicted Zn-dependent peptidase
VVPHPQVFTLANGLRATLVPYGRIPKVAISIDVRAGSLNEAPDQVWLSRLTALLMKEGTTSRSAEQVAAQAAEMGGSVDVSAGEDETGIEADVLSEYGPQMVRLLADVAQHPLLPASEVERLKRDLSRELAIAKSRPQPIAREHFRKLLYPAHPYGRIFPTEAMLHGYQIAQVKDFYSHNFSAARAHIYVAGMFDAAAVKQAISEAFSAWPAGATPLIEVPQPATRHTLEVIDRPGAPQSTLYIGLPTINPSDPDYIPLQVTNGVLGGFFSSRITTNIREQKGYTYSPSSQISSRYRDGYWVEVADVTTNVTGPAIKEIFYEIDRLRNEPPMQKEVEMCQAYLAGVFVIRNSSRTGMINQLQFVDLHQLGEKYLQNYVHNIYAVTPAQVQEMTRKYIDRARMTVVVVGDQQKIADQIAPYRPVGGGASSPSTVN